MEGGAYVRSNSGLVEGRYTRSKSEVEQEGKYERSKSGNRRKGKYERSKSGIVEGKYSRSTSRVEREGRYERQSSGVTHEGMYERQSSIILEGEVLTVPQPPVVLPQEPRYERLGSGTMLEGRFERSSSSIKQEGKYERQSSIFAEGEALEVPLLPVVLPASSFEALELLIVKLDDLLPTNPWGVAYGELENGTQYYVMKNAKPKDRAALALGVKVGSVLEKEDERGVAHIVEHLAFSATGQYTNHDIVRLLESFGAKLGPCQNAYTTTDETCYEFMIPIDKPENLSQALNILAEFSTEIRASDEDLAKERGAVLEEWRNGRDASGRNAEAYWQLLMKGSKYADRYTIGLEKVIKGVNAKRVQDFYQYWYRPKDMAIVAVGDFPNVDDVVKLIKHHFAIRESHIKDKSPPKKLEIHVPPHEEPRVSCLVDEETNESEVTITCKVPFEQMKTIKDYRLMIVEAIFLRALNQRFFRISKQDNPPFFSCSTSPWLIVPTIKAYTISASCPEGGTLQALEAMLIEVARVRKHGFSERELAVARADMMVEIKSNYLERDQRQSTHLRDECMRHFLIEETMPGMEYEAQLHKTFIPDISAAEVTGIADYYHTKCSCIIKTMEPHMSATEKEVKSVVAKIQHLESDGDIAPRNEEQLPDTILGEILTPGSIVETVEYPDLEATEITLDNGMRVSYKCTNFYDDEICFSGYAYGGLSEVEESDYRSCSMGSRIATEVGRFGHKPSILTEMLAGKLVGVTTDIGFYTRTFSGGCGTSDLETALQLVYQLFVTKVDATMEQVKLLMRMAHEGIRAQARDPYTAFSNRVTEINYGDSYHLKPWTAECLDKVDFKKACRYYDDCFKDPSSFTVALVGNIDTAEAIPLILQYLGGIPRPDKAMMDYKRDDLTGFTITYPTGVVREEVCQKMVEAQCSVYICFPIKLDESRVMEEKEYTKHVCKFLESKLTEVLRFKHGKIYSVNVSSFLGGRKPFGCEYGDISISFSCDPDMAWKLVDLTLDEVQQLQKEVPTSEMLSVLEIDQRGYENKQQENSYWVDRILQAYHAQADSQDLQSSLQVQDECREEVRSKASDDANMKEVLCRILPFPCKELYTAVILVPEVSRLQKIYTTFANVIENLNTDNKIVLMAAGVCVIGGVLWRVAARH